MFHQESGNRQDAVGLVQVNREGFRGSQGDGGAVIPPANQGVSGGSRGVVIDHGIAEGTEAGGCGEHGVSTAGQFERAGGLGAGDGANSQAAAGVATGSGQFGDVSTNSVGAGVGGGVGQGNLQNMSSTSLKLVDTRGQILDKLVVLVKGCHERDGVEFLYKFTKSRKLLPCAAPR